MGNAAPRTVAQESSTNLWIGNLPPQGQNRSFQGGECTHQGSSPPHVTEGSLDNLAKLAVHLSLIHISEPTRRS
eukprot:357716-Prymnesium_polylepis.1